jgi:hypothetical protein
MKLSTRIIASTAIALSLVGGAHVPAQATHLADGGGCAQRISGFISPCISFSTAGGGALHPDFYVNWTPGCNNKARMTVYVNGSPYLSWPFDLTYVGRYGPKYAGVNANPDRSARAFTRVQVWDCNWNWIGQGDSPAVDFVA